jgi:hypothetical protein
MQDLTLYYLFLKCNLMHYYFDKILLFAKSGCYRLANHRLRGNVMGILTSWDPDTPEGLKSQL